MMVYTFKTSLVVLCTIQKQIWEYQININWEDNVGDEDATVHKEKDKNKVKTMALATAMATLGMGNMRGLEDPSLGPMLLSHA